ncbi:hypothetical protein [Thalassospira australica]|uniref:hypothetical protein n=1 Tax=Thalassospira australica TaxID=1528106 RepID=UPI0012E00192|nr:hypothetical protein [Thalassospira australica]
MDDFDQTGSRLKLNQDYRLSGNHPETAGDRNPRTGSAVTVFDTAQRLMQSEAMPPANVLNHLFAISHKIKLLSK